MSHDSDHPRPRVTVRRGVSHGEGLDDVRPSDILYAQISPARRLPSYQRCGGGRRIIRKRIGGNG